ncbi:glutathione peroxidase [Mycobacterium sp. Soil538]|nr:glutathione peroxidase [Mycobacterium sp. Soil538]
MPEDQTADAPPNHLSIDPRSPFYDEEVLRRDVGVRFNGVEKNNVHEYNVDEGWVRVDVPTAKDRRGNPMVVKLSGTVEPYFRSSE